MAKDVITGLEEDLVEFIKDLCQTFEREDRLERENKRSLWLLLENYMHGLQRRYWDRVAQDWRRLPEDSTLEQTKHYDKIINIYRAHLESVAAALSVKVPSAIFYPEDADVYDDIATAKICVEIKKIIERHNQAPLQFIKAIVTLFNCGVVAAYIYNRRDSKYGTFKVPNYAGDSIKVTTVLENCPRCKSNIDEQIFKGEEDPKIPEKEIICPVCDYNGIPIVEKYQEDIPRIDSYGEKAKSRTCIEIFSPLFVHFPFYARSQELIPWLKLEFEQHYSLLKHQYPKMYKENKLPTKVDPISSEYRGIKVNSSESNLVTTKCWWIRPWAFDTVASGDKETDDKIKRLRQLYPDGFYAVVLDGELAEVHNEALDDHWQISHDPLETYLHADPIGKPLAPIQDLRNEVTDLQIETFEHAIPETFADPTVLDFKGYGKSQAKPGMVYPAKASGDGQGLASSFHTLKTATLSEESEVFNRRLDENAQFVVGSFPSIYGGPATSGSKTAREYTESRAMALQRFTLKWNNLKYWYANVIGVSVRLFIQSMKEDGQDHKEVFKRKTGFINQWIRQSDIQGRIGLVEADPEEDLPQTPAQLKDLAVQLLTLKDEFISDAMTHPENTNFLTKALGAPDFYIPGQDARNKQFEEFNDLLNGQQIEVKPWEDHKTEYETCTSFLMSSTGLIIKRENALGYQTIEEHALMHQQAIIQPQAQEPAPGAVNPEGAARNV